MNIIFKSFMLLNFEFHVHQLWNERGCEYPRKFVSQSGGTRIISRRAWVAPRRTAAARAQQPHGGGQRRRGAGQWVEAPAPINTRRCPLEKRCARRPRPPPRAQTAASAHSCLFAFSFAPRTLYLRAPKRSKYTSLCRPHVRKFFVSYVFKIYPP